VLGLRLGGLFVRKCINLADAGLRLVMAEIAHEPLDRAQETLQVMRECPHVVTLALARGEPGRTVGLYALPEDKLWWLEMLVEDPSLIKVQSARVSVLGPGIPEEVWLDVRPAEGEPPCGAECRTCRWYKNKCRGCPSSSCFLDAWAG
jgi:hypothetical protein